MEYDRIWAWQGKPRMMRGDFTSDEAWCQYKFERERKNEEIERLQARVKRVEKDCHNMLVCAEIAFFVMWLLLFAESVGWI